MTMSPTILCVKWRPSLRNQACITTLKRLQEANTHQSVWVAVGDKLPCQREQANSEDLFAVVVTKGELILGRFPKKFSTVCSVLLRRSGVNSVSGYEALRK